MTQPKAQLSAAIATALCGLSAVPVVSYAQSASTERPEEIIVTSSLLPTPKREIGTAVSVIDGPAIELRGYASLADVMRTQPGIGVSNSGGPGKSTSLRIRGEESYRTLLIIDGIKDVDPSGPQVTPGFDSLLATDDIERVEVLRGPQGFMYGADAGGVVNVITGRGTGFGGRVSLEGGDFDTRKITANLSGGDDKGDFYISAADLNTDGFNATVADNVLRDKDGADNTTLHAKLGLNATENLRLQLVFRDIDASAQYDNCFDSATFLTSNDCVGTTDQQTYRLSAEQHSGDFGNSFGYSNVNVARDNLTNGVSQFKTHGEIDRLEYTGSYKPSDMFALVYGVDLQQQQVIDETGGSTLSQDQDGYYVEYQGAFNDAFFLTVGARYDDNEDFGTHTSGRVSAAYVQKLNGGNALKYRASYGTGFRAPSPYEIAYNRGPFSFPPAAGLALNEETSEGYDLGIEVDIANGLHFEVTYFDQQITDEIFFDLVNFSGYLQSPGTSTSKGVELGLTAPLGSRWQLIANWTNNDTENTDNAQRLRRPKNLANFGVLYTSMSDSLRFVANYRLAKDALDVDTSVFPSRIVPLDNYEVLDLSVAYSLGKTWEIFGRIENATDEDYQEVFGYNTAGRAVYGGARLRF